MPASHRARLVGVVVTLVLLLVSQSESRVHSGTHSHDMGLSEPPGFADSEDYTTPNNDEELSTEDMNDFHDDHAPPNPLLTRVMGPDMSPNNSSSLSLLSHNGYQNPCNPNPCGARSTCYRFNNNYVYCDCQKGYSRANSLSIGDCTDTNACASHSCGANSYCTDKNPGQSQMDTKIPWASTWKYWNPDASTWSPPKQTGNVAWHRFAYNDGIADWYSGQAPLGYGNSASDYNTVISWGPGNSYNKNKGFFFRKTITLTAGDLNGVTGYHLRVKRDDDMKVWVNENVVATGIYTNNNQYAYYYMASASEFAPISATGNWGYAAKQPHNLVVGTNVIAIRVFAVSKSSSDTVFDAELTLEKGYTCTCNSGYEGDPWAGCTETNECSPNPCPQPGLPQTCTDGFQTYTCSCPAGYTMDGNGLCQNVDDCWPYPCASNTNCADGINTYTCSCKSGYAGDPNSAGCTNINDCPGTCSANADCVDGINSVTCTCKPGFTGDGTTCTDIDECAANPCGANTDCTTPTPNGYVCACKTGYEGDPNTGCTLINNCLPTDPCQANSVCAPILNDYTCTCLPGYSSVNAKVTPCTDIVDCTPGICGSDSTCTELVGGYTCACNSGFFDPDPSQDACVDIDDCTPNPCGTNAVCLDAGANAYTCSCPTGFTGDPNSACTDIDDCVANPCAAQTTCVDTGPNSRDCTCISGYESADNGDTIDCTNIDDCTGPYPCAANTDCTDGVNSYTCTCAAGTPAGDPYVGGCSAGIFCPGPCVQPNSFGTEGTGTCICSCDPGFSSPNAETTPCVNIDDCPGNTCVANSQCIDKVLGYECQCDSGYAPTGPATNPTACSNIDDCALTPCGANTDCVDGLNTRTCTCKLGFSGNPEVACTNIDDCAGGPCATNADCVDGIANYTCACQTGFTGDAYGAICVDIDDCTPNPCGTGANCLDTGVNSFSCSCPLGAAGNPNPGGACTQVDDCVPFPKCAAQATCTDGVGTFTCACNPGYESADPYTIACTDIDECAAATCRANSTCVDGLLSYTCPCNTGFTDGALPTDPCVNIDDCSPFPCGTNAICDDLIDDYYCRCPPGYEGNPSIECIDVDECLAQPCDVKATCQNLFPTGYKCTCPPGFGTQDGGKTCFADAGVLVLHGTLKTNELGGTATYFVRLAFAPGADVTITMASDNVNEVIPTPSNLVFSTSNWNQLQTVTLTGRDDDAVDGTQAATITHDVISSDFKYQNLSGILPSTPVLNEDGGETASLILQNADNIQVRETAGDGIETYHEYSVILTSRPLAPVTIDVTNSAPTQVLPTAQTILLDAGNWSIPATINVTAIDDALPDGPQTAVFRHSLSSAHDAYDAVGDVLINLVVQDDDSADIAPEISYVTPVSVVGGEITLTGQRFGVNSSIEVFVQIGRQSDPDSQFCTPVTWVSNSTLTCTAPPGSGAGKEIWVTVANIPNTKVYDAFFYITTIIDVRLIQQERTRGATQPLVLGFRTSRGLPSECDIYLKLPVGFSVPGPVTATGVVPELGLMTAVASYDAGTNITTINIDRLGSGPVVAAGMNVQIELNGVVNRGALGTVSKKEYELEVRAYDAIAEFVANYEGPTTGVDDLTIIDTPTAPLNAGSGDLQRTTTTISWSAPMTDNLSPISAYNIYRGGVKVASVDGDTLAYTLQGLTPYTDYTSHVTAVNSAGESVISDIVSFKTVYDVPSVTSVSPLMGNVEGGTVIDIKGSSFTDGVTQVKDILIGENSCGSTKVWISETHIRCTTPPTQIKSSISIVSVSVETAYGKTTFKDPFTYYPNPTIASISELSGGAGGGTSIIIIGTWLGSSIDDILSVSVAGVDCSGIEYFSATKIVCITGTYTPGSAAAKGKVKVTTRAATGESVQEFEYEFPKIIRIEPQGAVATGGTIVTMTGQNLGLSQEDVTALAIAGIDCKSSLWYDSSTRIGCVSPQASPNIEGPVTVSTLSSASGSSAPLTFKFLSEQSPSLPSLVLKLNPESVPLTGNVRVGVSGVWLGIAADDVEEVLIGDEPCTSTVEWKNSSYIECTAPPAAKIGKALVKVKTKSSGMGNSQASLLYSYPPPVVEAIRPAESKQSGGQMLTVRGKYFGEKDTRQAEVIIGGISCQKTIWLSSELVLCETPPLSSFPKAEQDKLLGPARSVQFRAVVRIGSLASPESTEVVTYYDDSAQTCSPPCGWTAKCVGAECKCIAGYSNPPKCEEKNVIVTDIIGSTSELEAAGTTASFSLTLSEPPDAFNPVIIRVLSNDTSEGLVQPGSLTFSTTDWSVAQTATVTGVADTIRDGNITYSVRSIIKHGPRRFTESPTLPTQELVNHERPPEILKMWPSAIPLSGGRVNVIVRNLDINFTLSTATAADLQVVSRKIITNTTVLPTGHDSELVIEQVATAANSTSSNGNATSTEPAVPVDPRSLEKPSDNILLEVNLPPHTEGYHRLTLLNEGGTRIDKDRWLYFSGGCIRESSFGSSGGDCQQCKNGAECPGGNRLWPTQGNFNTGEQSGFVETCDPPERCKGGRLEGDMCNEGYQGFLCGDCAPGFVKREDLCKACPPIEQLAQFAAAVCVLWLTIAAISAFMRDQVMMSLMTQLFRGFQVVAAISVSATHLIPTELVGMYQGAMLFSGDLLYHDIQCFPGIRFSWEAVFFMRLGYNLLIFLPFLVFVPVACLIAVQWHKSTTYYPDPEHIRATKAYYWDRFKRSFLAWCMLMYFSITWNVTDVLTCREINGERYLVSNPSQKCMDGTLGLVITGISGFLVLAYCVGFPAFVVLRLRSARDKIHAPLGTYPHFAETNSILFDQFKPGTWAWTVLDYVTIFVIALGPSMLHPFPLILLIAGSLLCIGKMALVLIASPYANVPLSFYHFIINIGYILVLTTNYLAGEGMLKSKLVGTMLSMACGFFVALPSALMLAVVLFAIFFEKNLTKKADEEDGASGSDDEKAAALLENAGGSSGDLDASPRTVDFDDVVMSLESEEKGDGSKDEEAQLLWSRDQDQDGEADIAVEEGASFYTNLPALPRNIFDTSTDGPNLSNAFGRIFGGAPSDDDNDPMDSTLFTSGRDQSGLLSDNGEQGTGGEKRFAFDFAGSDDGAGDNAGFSLDDRRTSDAALDAVLGSDSEASM